MLSYLRNHRRVSLIGLITLLMVTVTMMTGALILADVSNVGSVPFTKTTPLNVTPIDVHSPIAAENEHQGDDRWAIDDHTNTTYIQGYTSTTSALPNENMAVFVSSVKPIDYQLDVYRMGYYGGKSARLMYTETPLQSKAQGYWTLHANLADCHTCAVDPETHEIDAHWQNPVALHINADWLSGVYLIKLTSLDPQIKAASYIPFVVRSLTPNAAILVEVPFTTYQAYNYWGGYSLYTHAVSLTNDLPSTTLDHATKVSFNRPYAKGAGTSDFLNWDFHSVRWLERSAFDVSYITSVDLHQNPEQLKQHQVFLSIGHDEYWSKAMRDGAESARDAGVSLAFWGADDVYWQIRFEPDASGTADRTEVCYKVLSNSKAANEQLKLDPMYPDHPDIVTSQFRDPVVGRPENNLLGIMYESYFTSGYYPDWIVSTDQLDTLAINTGLAPGEHIKGGLLGYEYDGISNNGQTPAGIVILASSPVINKYKVHETANTAYYRAKSGALVFDAGTIWWSWGLDDTVPVGAAQNNNLKGNDKISQLTTNILHAMLLASPPPALAPTPTPTAIPTPTKGTNTPVPTVIPTKSPTVLPTHTPTHTP